MGTSGHLFQDQPNGSYLAVSAMAATCMRRLEAGEGCTPPNQPGARRCAAASTRRARTILTRVQHSRSPARTRRANSPGWVCSRRRAGSTAPTRRAPSTASGNRQLLQGGQRADLFDVCAGRRRRCAETSRDFREPFGGGLVPHAPAGAGAAEITTRVSATTTKRPWPKALEVVENVRMLAMPNRESKRAASRTSPRSV